MTTEADAIAKLPAEYRRAARVRAEREKARKRVKRAQAKASQIASAKVETSAEDRQRQYVIEATAAAREAGWQEGYQKGQDDRMRAEERTIIAGFLNMERLCTKMGEKAVALPIHEVQVIAKRLRADQAKPERPVSADLAKSLGAMIFGNEGETVATGSGGAPVKLGA